MIETLDGNFIARINYHLAKPPMRAYVFAGAETFNPHKAADHFEKTIKYLRSFRKLNFEFILAGLWIDKDKNAKMIDFFGYKGITGNTTRIGDVT